MDISDNIVRFYIQHFIMSKAQNIDVPGFVFFKLPGKASFFARQIVIPEAFFVNFESIMAAKGKETASAIYSAGKRFGYSFSLLGGFSNYNDKKGQQLVDYINVINKFIEGTYATKIDCKVDVDTKSCRYSMENPIVVGKLGYGYFLPLGAAAGLMAYLFQDPSIEGVLENFDLKEGNGILLYGPAGYLKGLGKKFFTETNLANLEPTADYIKLNAVRNLKNSDYSLRTLLDSKFFTFSQGFVMNGDQRYFILEVSALYLIENDLSAYSKEIYGAAFKTGIEILETVKNPSLKTLVDYLSAFGWGDILITKSGDKYKVGVEYFPYTKFYKDASFLIFSGLLAGMLSTISGKTVKFSKIEKNLVRGYFEVLFS